LARGSVDKRSRERRGFRATLTAAARFAASSASSSQPRKASASSNASAGASKYDITTGLARAFEWNSNGVLPAASKRARVATSAFR
jgi:hypothetical protein